MTNLFSSKTNFSAGELSTDLLGRVDLTAYANGAMALKNVFPMPRQAMNVNVLAQNIITITIF